MIQLVCLLTLGLGGPTHLSAITSAEMFDQVAAASRDRPDITAATKFIVPASSEPDLLATTYQNVQLYPFHLEFLATEFPDRFPDLTANEYRRLVEQRATRKYFAGVLFRLEPGDGEVLYGFMFYTDQALESELPRREEVDQVFQRLSETFTAGPLVYAPVQPDVIELVRGWEGTPFPIYLPDFGLVGDFRAYTTGTAYGSLRIFSLGELIEASEAGEVGWRDIVAVDEAPQDLSSPVSGLISGTPQTELSHLSLRLAQRGTPNAFLDGVVAELEPFRDELVRIDVTDGTISVTRVDDPREAEEWWRTHRPRLPTLPGADVSDERLMSLEAMADDPEAVSKYGAKASNLALLRTALPDEFVVDGFGIPFAWYQRFMDENLIREPEGSRLVSYSEYVARIDTDERYRAQPVLRTRLLDEFVEHAEDHGDIPEGLVGAAAARILETFGSTAGTVRCRSSSNFEDIVPFNGAGLYRSGSACAADSLDADGRGPSRCDPASEDERTLERGFRRVWSSLWFPRAYGERDFWQAPQARARMGVLVTPAFTDEAANGVVLTGNPSLPGDDRFVINVQLGEVSVVEPPAGDLAEKVLLEVEDGAVTEVRRVRPSSLLPEGEWVLSEDEARTIGELAAAASSVLAPRFATGLGDILLDFEFKVEEEAGGRRIVFKQARPFLREAGTAEPPLALVVPESAEACGVFSEFRTLAEEYSLLARMTLVPGRLDLPAGAANLDADLIAALLVGPAKEPATPLGPGTFRPQFETAGSRRIYLYTYTQSFRVGTAPLDLELRLPPFWTDSEGSDETELIFDESFLSLSLDMRATFGEERLIFASCTYAALPLYETTVTAVSGERIVLRGRHLPPLAGSGPENLVSATVELAGSTRTQSDYWRLVFAADHHNWDRRYWVLLDPPIGDTHVVELREATRFTREPPVLRLLVADFRLLRDLAVASWERTRIQDVEWPEFVRGDANGDGQVDVADALGLVDYLFRGGGRLSCRDAADADDDCQVSVTDAVRIILHLFQGGESYELPAPGALRCGKDTTDDALPCAYDVSTCF